MATHPARRGWSYTEFAKLRDTDDRQRYEIIDGELVVTPTPRLVHQEVVARLFLELRSFATVQHGLGRVLSPIDVLFTSDNYLTPDIAFVRSDHRHLETERGIEGPPDLVVEVLSPSTAKRDRGVKRVRYAMHGVPEYWIVDPDAGRVEVYTLQADADYPRVHSERLRWEPVPGGPVLEIDLPALFADLI